MINMIDSYQFFYYNFKTKIHKSTFDSIINFIKINNINNLKIKEHSKYLILNYNENLKIKEPKINNTSENSLITITNDKIYLNDEFEFLNNDDEIINKEDLSIYEKIISNKKPILIKIGRAHV